MNQHIIKNWAEIARTKERNDALGIAESGLQAINTKNSIKEKLSLIGNVLRADDRSFDLTNFEKIFVFAFGKASTEAVMALEEILGDRITAGIALDKRAYKGKKVEVFEGSHPHPSEYNVTISEKIAELAKSMTDKDLVIVVASGGGSALLCYPEKECEQGNTLYSAFLSSGGNIRDLNVIRKHISEIKGGGLAKLLYPATIISLILCDVSGEYYEDVASGPTYKDNTTVKDVEDLLEKFNVKGSYELNETPKEDKYFEKVYNIPVVSNMKALRVMKKYAEDLGYNTIILSGELYDAPDEVLRKMISISLPKTVVLGGGEPTIKVLGTGGKAGRNEHTSLCAIKQIDDDSVFISLASDGIDNKSKYAGAIVDKETLEIAKQKVEEVEDALANFNPEPFFLETKDVIETGPTEANVSDLFILLKK